MNTEEIAAMIFVEMIGSEYWVKEATKVAQANSQEVDMETVLRHWALTQAKCLREDIDDWRKHGAIE